MTSRPFALGLLAVLLAPLAARAEDTKLPFNPFEKAAKDDWCVLTGTFRRDEAGEKKGPCASYARVTRVEGADVTVATNDQNGGVVKSERKHSKNEAPTLEAVFGLDTGTVSGVKWTDDKRSLDGKDVACKKVTFTWKHDASTDEITAWFAPQVKAGGLVGVVYRGQLKADGADDAAIETIMKLELASYGTGEKADMGETPESVLDFEMLAGTSVAELPLKVFADAKEGDWSAYRVEAEEGDRTESGFVGFEVTGIAKGMVKLEETSRFRDRSARTREVELKRADAPGAAAYVQAILEKLRGDAVVSLFKVTDENRTAAGREFACKRVSFTLKSERDRVKVRLWLSAEVKATGLVAMELSVKEHARSITLTFELGGFGDDDKTLCGKSLEQLVKKKKKSDDE